MCARYRLPLGTRRSADWTRIGRARVRPFDVRHYGSRYWAIYLNVRLLAVTVYKKGALAIQKALGSIFSGYGDESVSTSVATLDNAKERKGWDSNPRWVAPRSISSRASRLSVQLHIQTQARRPLALTGVDACLPLTN